MKIKNDDLHALVDFVQRLLQTSSLSGHEGALVGLMAAEMQKLGFDQVWVDDYGSVIGFIEGDQPGPTLLFDGHCDTVDANAADWTFDPLGGAIEAGRIYGRGAADMKASLAAMVYAVGNSSRKNLRGRVVVSGTVCEEVAEGAALCHVMAAFDPDYVVIGEATGLNLNRAGRGRAEIKITTHGQSAHSSSPGAGHCAVTDMTRLLAAVIHLPVREDALLGPASIVLTDIISEPYPGHSVIPYRCHVTLDRRLLPGESWAQVLAGLNQAAVHGKIAFNIELAPLAEMTHTGKLLEGEKFFPAWTLPENHPLIVSGLKNLRMAGLDPQVGAYRFCTNAAYSAGVANLPTLGFGIGEEEDAHSVDESIAIEDLRWAFVGYQGLMRVLDDLA